MITEFTLVLVAWIFTFEAFVILCLICIKNELDEKNRQKTLRLRNLCGL